MRQVSQESRLNFHSPHRLKLGLFGSNVSQGRVATVVPEAWTGNWEDNLRMARIADDAGLDFLLPLGRWKGYGGPNDYQGSTWETVTWATGLLAKTKNITAFATVHAPLLHPVIAAKEMVTADHISEGRFGLNLVCGWNEGEFGMFGATVREHEQRYEYAQEWIDAVRLAWGDQEDFDYNGKFIKMKSVRAKPKPYGGSRPVLMNAGQSQTGKAFAARNCDAMFISMEITKLNEAAERINTIKETGRRSNKEVGVFTAGFVVCRPTHKEAEEYYRYATHERADWGAVEGLMAIRKVDPAKLSKEELETMRRRYTSGQGGLPIIGTPDQVAEQLSGLASVGILGFGFSLVNFANELPYICDEVLPRLKKLGLRA